MKTYRNNSMNRTQDPVQNVTVVKRIYSTTWPDYAPVLYEIEVDEECISFITEQSARSIHERLGNLLHEKEASKEQSR